MYHDFLTKQGLIIHLNSLRPRRETVNKVQIAQTPKASENRRPPKTHVAALVRELPVGKGVRSLFLMGEVPLLLFLICEVPL